MRNTTQKKYDIEHLEGGQLVVKVDAIPVQHVSCCETISPRNCNGADRNYGLGVLQQSWQKSGASAGHNRTLGSHRFLFDGTCPNSQQWPLCFENGSGPTYFLKQALMASHDSSLTLSGVVVSPGKGTAAGRFIPKTYGGDICPILKDYDIVVVKKNSCPSTPT